MVLVVLVKEQGGGSLCMGHWEGVPHQLAFESRQGFSLCNSSRQSVPVWDDLNKKGTLQVIGGGMLRQQYAVVLVVP